MLSDPFFSDDPVAIAAAAAAALGVPLPEACREGVVANVLLLRQHLATLRDGPGEIRKPIP